MDYAHAFRRLAQFLAATGIAVSIYGYFFSGDDSLVFSVLGGTVILLAGVVHYLATGTPRSKEAK